MQDVAESLDFLVADAGTQQEPLFVCLAHVSQTAESVEKSRDVGPVDGLDRGQRLHHERHVLILDFLLNRRCALALYDRYFGR